MSFPEIANKERSIVLDSKALELLLGRADLGFNHDYFCENCAEKAKDERSRNAHQAMTVLMNSRNLEELQKIMESPFTPDHIKIEICHYFVKDRCFSVNGKIGSICGGIALQNYEELFKEKNMEHSRNNSHPVSLTNSQVRQNDHVLEKIKSDNEPSLKTHRVKLPDGSIISLPVATDEEISDVNWD